MSKDPHIKPDPEPGDIYRTSPATSLTGDVHGKNMRPVGITDSSERTIRTIARTTQHPRKQDLSLFSPKMPEVGLTKDGYWMARRLRPIVKERFANPEHCQYLGELPSTQRDELLTFWKQLTLLGLAN